MSKLFSIKSIMEQLAKNKSGDFAKVYAPVQASVKGKKGIGEPMVFIMSNEIRDRDGEVMVLSGAKLDNYNANPLVCWMHHTRKSFWHESDYDPDNVIGKGRAYIEGDNLMNEIMFEPKEINEKAWKVESKIEFGSLNMGSIGFIPLDGHMGQLEDGEDTGTLYITDWELTEYSIVTVPANPTAAYQKDLEHIEQLNELNKKDIKEMGTSPVGLSADVARAQLFHSLNSL